MKTRTLLWVCALTAVLSMESWALAKGPTAKGTRGKVEVKLEIPGGSAGKVQPRPHYDVLLQFHIPTFAEEIVAEIQKGIDKELSGKKFGESSEDFAIRRVIVESIGKWIIQAVKQTDDVSLGWKLDRTAKRTYLDLTATALHGTPLAKRFAQVAQLKTSFSGFRLGGAALSANWVGQASVEEATTGAKVVLMVRDRILPLVEDPGLTPEAQKKRKELVSRLFDVVAVTAAGGKSDGAMSLVLRPDQVTLVAGAYVADGKKLESVVKPVATFLSERHEVLANLKLDVGTFQGVSLHTLSIPAPTNRDREKFVRMFGKSLDVVLGFGPQAAYLAVGKGAMASLRKAIQKSAKPVVPTYPFEVSLALRPVADFIAKSGKLHQRIPAGLIATALGKAPGKDHVRLVAKPIHGGITLRLEIEQGVLELIGAISPKAKRFLLRQ